MRCGGEGILEGECDCDGNVLDVLGVCGGDCTDDYDGDGVCDELEIYGCTDDTACNFNSESTIDDGSCQYLDALGICGGDCDNDIDNDGICDPSCLEDLDNDGIMTVQDLLLSSCRIRMY